MIVLSYVDDCIVVRQSIQKIDAFVKLMEVGPDIFTLTVEGDIDKFLGIGIKHLEEKIFEISQPFLRDRIISFLNIDTNDPGLETNSELTPIEKKTLHKDLSGKPHKDNWNCQTAVGMLTYLQGNSRPEISMAIHQTARFRNNPKLLDEKSLKRLGQYLLHKTKYGRIYNPNKQKGLE